ncbi:GNAT family N-acetyltransferase [Streptomyces sp. NPDC000983]|uniref:GNAT family N-acetyltransferase n=1 Tax=Streptomyces sp. NPDC000983 TaxID=3154373 RepID=UPI00331A6FC8
MTDRCEVSVVRRPGLTLSGEDGLTALLAAYHARTEAEKAYHLRTEAERGTAVTEVGPLPARYRAEIADPRTAFADDVVLIAVSGRATVGCLVVTAPDGGRSEIKRLWTVPAFRGLGVASDLLGAALAQAAESGVGRVRLSVWDWRTGAISLYERFGFAVTESWETRDRLVCMERAV